MHKDAHLLNLCRTRDDYRELWDARGAALANEPRCLNWELVSPGVWKCPTCERRAGAASVGALPSNRICGKQKTVAEQPIGFGPGTELAALLESIGIKELPGCGCKKKMRQMDRWGVDGCKQHFDEIVTWMRDGYEKAGLIAKVRSAAFAAAIGLAFKLEPGNPLPGLVKEAIRRAEQNLLR
jgi:hypothetical protein